MKGNSAFTALYYRAVNGELSREEWIRENTRLEYGALHRTARVYTTYWRPWAEARGLPSSGRYWDMDVPSTYEEWISYYTNPNGYPWDSFGRYYDEEIVPYLESKKHPGY